MNEGAVVRSHGVMFHHFHSSVHPRGQGAISQDDLFDMISYLERDNIFDAPEWADLAIRRALPPNALCLTFDDALKCQLDVAAPVLDHFNIKAFWFVYSSVFQGGVELLEVYRYFRTVVFEDIDEFYDAFFKRASADFGVNEKAILSGFDPDRYLPDDPFYTRNDRTFRFIRDDILKPKRYRSVMDAMLAEAGFDIIAIKDRLWMTNDDLRSLDAGAHCVGLHSFSHPTRLCEMTRDAQQMEYQRNYDHLRETLTKAPIAVSHPCNSYDSVTLEILRDMGIKIGFRAYPKSLPEHSDLEFPREDHALIMARMRQ